MTNKNEVNQECEMEVKVKEVKVRGRVKNNKLPLPTVQIWLTPPPITMGDFNDWDDEDYFLEV